MEKNWDNVSGGILTEEVTNQVPWLMLAPDESDIIIGDNGEEVERRRFYDVIKGKEHHVFLPEHIRKKRCLSSRGWLLTVSRHLFLALLNPFSGRIIHPPCLYLDNTCRWRFYIEKFALSSSPSSKDDDEDEEYTMMVIYGSYYSLAVWSVGASVWTDIDSDNTSDVVYSDGLFYVLDLHLKVTAYLVEPFWDETLDRRSHRVNTQLHVDMGVAFSSFSKTTEYYLAWSQGKLLAISRHTVPIDSEADLNKTIKVWMAELNLETLQVVPIKDLGNRSLFLGSNESISLEVDGVEGCTPNSIYFTDVEWALWPSRDDSWLDAGGRNMGIFNLTDESFTPHYPGESLSRITPPLWVLCRP